MTTLSTATVFQPASRLIVGATTSAAITSKTKKTTEENIKVKQNN